MERLTDLFEVLRIDLEPTLSRLGGFLEPQEDLDAIRMFYYDPVKDIIRLAEDILNAMRPLRNTPLYDDVRVLEFEESVEALLEKIPKEHKLRYRFRWSKGLNSCYELLLELKEKLVIQATEPPIYVQEEQKRTVEEWSKDTEKGLFEN